MVTMVISELKFVSRLKIFPETGHWTLKRSCFHPQQRQNKDVKFQSDNLHALGRMQTYLARLSLWQRISHIVFLFMVVGFVFHIKGMHVINL